MEKNVKMLIKLDFINMLLFLMIIVSFERFDEQ